MRNKALILGLTIGAALILGGCDIDEKRQQQLEKKPHVALIDLRGGAPEAVASGGLFPRGADETYVGLVRKLQKMEVEDKLKAVFVRVGEGMTFHGAAELSELLVVLREKRHLPVVCHAHGLSNASASFMLRACDERWLSRAGDASTVGIAAETVYLKGALDRFGIVAEMLAMGRFKSGAEALTRDGPSEASGQNLIGTLAHLRTEWLNQATRGAPPANVDLWQAALEDGPWSPPAALAHGLVDKIGYEDEAISALKARAQVDVVVPVFGGGHAGDAGDGLAELMRLLASQKTREKTPRIAVLPLVGSITMDGGGPLGDGGIAASSTVRVLRKLRQDDNVKAVVVRLDSPGGSPLASDLIWHELMLMRAKKPVIASIGGMAASGGYYIACGATKIVAPETAIVGSIGVFGGKIVFGEALAKLGVTSHAFPANPDPVRGARALHQSPLSLWDEATRVRVRENMQHIYDLFVARVAEGRGIEKDAVYKTAEGEIFLAATGRDRGLIDELGGVARSLELARELASLGSDTLVSVEGATDSIFETLLQGDEPDEEAVRAFISGLLVRRHTELQALGLGEAEVAAMQPFHSILAPLLGGEEIVAALPFVLTVH